MPLPTEMLVPSQLETPHPIGGGQIFFSLRQYLSFLSPNSWPRPGQYSRTDGSGDWGAPCPNTKSLGEGALSDPSDQGPGIALMAPFMWGNRYYWKETFMEKKVKFYLVELSPPVKCFEQVK